MRLDSFTIFSTLEGGEALFILRAADAPILTGKASRSRQVPSQCKTGGHWDQDGLKGDDARVPRWARFPPQDRPVDTIARMAPFEKRPLSSLSRAATGCLGTPRGRQPRKTRPTAVAEPGWSAPMPVLLPYSRGPLKPGVQT
jgi:hypothetical protein